MRNFKLLATMKSMKSTLILLIAILFVLTTLLFAVAVAQIRDVSRQDLSTPEITLPVISTDFQIDLAACDTAILKIYQAEFDSLVKQYRAQSETCAVLLKYHRNK